MAGAAHPGGDPEAEYLIVATVRKPHGIRGDLLIGLETDRADAVFRPGRVLWVGDAEGRPTERRLTLERVRPFKGGLLLKAAEFNQRTDEMDGLRGSTLLLPAAEVAPLAEGEVFYHQLIGLRVRADGAEVGVVRDLMESPAGPLLVVRRPRQRDLLVPFIKEMVSRVDPEAGVLELDPPTGLLEL